MNNPIFLLKNYLKQLKVGGKQSSKNLALSPREIEVANLIRDDRNTHFADPGL
jgi:hypothetical protein